MWRSPTERVCRDGGKNIFFPKQLWTPNQHLIILKLKEGKEPCTNTLIFHPRDKCLKIYHATNTEVDLGLVRISVGDHLISLFGDKNVEKLQTNGAILPIYLRNHLEFSRASRMNASLHHDQMVPLSSQESTLWNGNK